MTRDFDATITLNDHHLVHPAGCLNPFGPILRAKLMPAFSAHPNGVAAAGGMY
jgi:hypothetical protein